MKPLVVARHMLRHAALGAVVYISFRFFPQNKMSSNNVLILTGVVVAVHVVFEYLCGMYRLGEMKETETKDAGVKALLENFASTNAACPCAPVEGFASIGETEPEIIPGTVVDANPVTPEPVLEPVPEPEPEVSEEKKTIDGLKTRINQLEKVVREYGQQPTELQNKMDPFNDPGHSYSVNQNSDSTRGEDGVSLSDMKYTDHNHLPVSDNYRSVESDYGWSYLPPEKWYPQPPNPPVCVTQKRCPVLPGYTSGAPVDVKEWYSASRITPPDNINTQYVRDRLNAGR